LTVEAGETYQFYVVAKNGKGNGDPSTLVSVKAGSAPSAVTNLGIALDREADSATFTFDAADMRGSIFERYDVFVKGSGDY
jgi:hypothetical protein